MNHLVFLLAITLLNSFGQTHPVEIQKHTQDSIVYVQKSIEFIKKVKGKELADSRFILVDKPFAFNYFNCLEKLLADSITFSSAELDLIRQKKYPSVTRWSGSFFPAITLISGDTIDSIFKKKTDGWNYFYKNIGGGFGRFSMPIFLRNDTYCIFYADQSCGWLCGEGQLVLYKMNNGKWEEIRSYCSWIS
ncbi:MAG: hypothetical protein HYU70_01125 [Bacteroidetes bacterium]|nr:hypothetical protein [Bacteroidota bacterium]